jgi:hypothetical protein
MTTSEDDKTLAATVLKAPRWLAHRIGIKSSLAICAAALAGGIGLGVLTTPDDESTTTTTTTAAAAPVTTVTTEYGSTCPPEYIEGGICTRYAHADDWDLDGILDTEDPSTCMPLDRAPVSVEVCDEDGRPAGFLDDDPSDGCDEPTVDAIDQYGQPMCTPPPTCDAALTPLHYDTEFGEWVCGGGM